MHSLCFYGPVFLGFLDLELNSEKRAQSRCSSLWRNSKCPPNQKGLLWWSCTLLVGPIIACILYYDIISEKKIIEKQLSYKHLIFFHPLLLKCVLWEWLPGHLCRRKNWENTLLLERVPGVKSCRGCLRDRNWWVGCGG